MKRLNRVAPLRTATLLLLVGVFAWSAAQEAAPELETVETAAGSYQELSPAGLDARLEESGNLLLINTHIPYAGAIPSTDAFIPFNEIEQYASVLPEDKNAEIVVYCRSGGMSKSASESLVALGYQNVKRLVGGMNAWQNAGYELQNAATN